MPTTGPDTPGRARVRWLERLAGAQIDLAPLRESAAFRILFLSGAVSYVCQMFAYIAVPYQLYALTGSNLAVGAMGAVQLVPIVVFGLWGGVLADRVDRRTLLLLTGVAQVVLMAVLIVNALAAQPQVWLLYVVGALLATANALRQPSREAMIPRVVKHHQIPAAIAISSLTYQLGMLVGPGLAGLLIAHTTLSLAYLVALVGSLLGTVVLVRLPSSRPVRDPDQQPVTGVRQVTDGLRYAVGRKDLLGTYVIDMVGMFLAMPVVLFPALAEEVFARPELLGLLYSAEAVGSMVATVTSGWTAKVHHHGRAVVLAAIAWGGFTGLAGLAPNIWLAIALLGVAGGCDMISGLFRGTIWHQTVPDHLRGRLAGIEMLSYSIGPLGGQLRSGLVADLTSVRASIVSGGVMCVLGVAGTAAALRGFWAYDARTDEHAVRQRAVREAEEAAAAD